MNEAKPTIKSNYRWQHGAVPTRASHWAGHVSDYTHG